ncbi:MAG: hypothetical protein FJ202_08280 [Gemmatimonadetes bacterium]|nr:hypothetical protein [Gemmatimonadota bacterium]
MRNRWIGGLVTLAMAGALAGTPALLDAQDSAKAPRQRPDSAQRKGGGRPDEAGQKRGEGRGEGRGGEMGERKGAGRGEEMGKKGQRPPEAGRKGTPPAGKTPPRKRPGGP